MDKTSYNCRIYEDLCDTEDCQIFYVRANDPKWAAEEAVEQYECGGADYSVASGKYEVMVDVWPLGNSHLVETFSVCGWYSPTYMATAVPPAGYPPLVPKPHTSLPPLRLWRLE